MSDTLTEVRDARRDELWGTAHLHRRHLPAGFFARLGSGFLRRYHRTFAQSPVAEILVAPTRRGPAGMLAGTYDNASHYRWVVRRRGWLLLLSGLVALLRRPPLAVEFVRTRAGRYARAVARRLRPGTRGGADDGPASAPTACRPTRVAVLTHVTVDAGAQGRGIGRRLVETFVRRARRRGADEVRLITDAGGPGADFYRSLGWHRLARRRAADGTLVDEFVLPL